MPKKTHTPANLNLHTSTYIKVSSAEGEEKVLMVGQPAKYESCLTDDDDAGGTKISPRHIRRFPIYTVLDSTSQKLSVQRGLHIGRGANSLFLPWAQIASAVVATLLEYGYCQTNGWLWAKQEGEALNSNSCCYGDIFGMGFSEILGGGAAARGKRNKKTEFSKLTGIVGKILELE